MEDVLAAIDAIESDYRGMPRRRGDSGGVFRGREGNRQLDGASRL